MSDALEEQPFGHALADLGARLPNLVVLDADLQRVMETNFFQERFPDRHFNVGIAEANMIGIAAGLALSGKIVLCGTFASFITQRVCDQVAISVAYCDANVKLVGIEAGLASGRNGASHQAMLDLAIMRAMPNMAVFVPADATETKAVLTYLLTHPGPAYMRAPRGHTPVLFDPDEYRFQAGQAAQMRAGCDATIIACGIMVPRALEAAEKLASEGLSCRVLNMSSIKPLDEQAIIRCARETGCLVTAENHNVLGGLGSAVAEVVTQHCPVPVVRVGVPDVFGEVGSTEWLAQKFGLDVPHVMQAVRQAVTSRQECRRPLAGSL